MYRRKVDVQSNVTAVTDSMKVGDPRLAIQLPQDVITAGVKPNHVIIKTIGCEKYLYLVFAIALVSCGVVLSSCGDDKISGDSIFSTKAVERNAFDQWLCKNYPCPYNIDFQYRLKTEETEQTYNFVPADSAKTVKLPILTKGICGLMLMQRPSDLTLSRRMPHVSS